jgi:hypothetical protein
MVSKFNGIELDKVWDLPVRRFLNDLSYLKMKMEVDEEYMRRMEQKQKMRYGG